MIKTSFCGLAVISFLAYGVAQADREVPLGQPFKTDSGRFLYAWHFHRPGLILYRDAANRTEPSVIVFTREGQSVMSVNPLVDLVDSSAKRVDVWGAAGAPDGGVVLQTVIAYEGKGVRNALITYAVTGKLTKVWDVYPFHYHSVTVDGNGYVYAFGHRLNAALKARYPLLIKYSPTGRVVGEFLDSETVSKTENPTRVVEDGLTQLVQTRDGLSVYVGSGDGSRAALFRLGYDGRLRGHGEISSEAMVEVARSVRMDRASIVGFTVAPGGEAVVQVRVWKDKPLNASGWLIVQSGDWRQGWSVVSPFRASDSQALSRLVAVDDVAGITTMVLRRGDVRLLSQAPAVGTFTRR